MLTAKNLFSKNGQDTIRVIDPNYKGKLGGQGELTDLDRVQTDILYSCLIGEDFEMMVVIRHF